MGQVSTLVNDEGGFLGRTQFARKLLLGRIKPMHIVDELDAQWERLLALGVKPTHLDSHQHIHAFSTVFGAIAALCKRERIPMRVPWVAPEQGAGLGRRARRSVLAALLSSSTRRWQGRVCWNDGIGSVFDLGVQGGQLSEHHYRAVLERAGGTAFELMVHPVTSAAAMDGYTRIGAIGEAEYNWLRGGELVDLASSLGFNMGRYDDLAR
jgi:chitin disaccharide deacetylase